MKHAILFFSFLMFVSCNVDKAKKVDSDAVRFGFTDPSHIFFKNVRQIFYDREENVAAKLYVNRLRSRVEYADHPLINLAIVINWRFREAYLLLEPSGFTADPDEILVKWKSKDGEEGDYLFDFGNKETHLRFATKVYNGILEEQQFLLKDGDSYVDFLSDEKERETFRVTLFDYLKLVEML